MDLLVFDRFYRLEIHSLMVAYFDPTCELLPPMDEGTILVYCCPSTFSLHDLPTCTAKKFTRKQIITIIKCISVDEKYHQ
jgi:hypothetical protein